jgi:DNA-binding transcriptional LysR family regulator
VELGKHFKILESTLAHAQLLNKGLLGDLKLGYVGSAMEKVIPRLMNGFRETHQKVMFSLKEMDNQDQIKSLFSNEIDVGFVRMERVPKGLKASTILQEPFCLVVPKNHPINNKNFKGISQLKDASFILFDPKYSPSYYEKVMQIFDDSGFTPIVTHNTIHSGSIYKLVAHHFGVSIVPKSLKSDHLKEVRFIELHDIPQQTALSAVWNENNRNPVLDDFLVQVQSFKSVH